MKYLKAINEYNTDDILYHQITYNANLSNEYFDVKNEDILKKEFKGENIYFQNHGTCFNIVYNKKNKNIIEFEIRQLPDEYFFIRLYKSKSYNYYKCDTIQGVIKFVKDNLPNNNPVKYGLNESNNTLYHEIEYNDYLLKKMKQINLDDKDVYELDYKFSQYKVKDGYVSYSSNVISFNNVTKVFDIWKLPDEYFIVREWWTKRSTYNHYYLCDTIEGVLQLIDSNYK